MGAAGVVIGIISEGFPGRRRKLLRPAKIGRHTVNHALFRAIWIDRANDVTALVIVHRHLLTALGIRWSCVIPAIREKWFVFLNDLTLVVIDLPSAHHHTWRAAH